MISDERMEKSLRFLAETDEQAAELKVMVSRKEYVVDYCRRTEFLKETGNIEERKAKAETTNRVTIASDSYLTAMLDWEKLKAKRATEELIVEVWRTLSANRRQGGRI